MKNILSRSALLVLSGYVLADAARSLGLYVPDALNLGSAFLAYVGVMSALLLVADYGPKARPVKLPVFTRNTQQHRPSVAAAYRHVYAIRRGAEAARLAKAPGRIVIFPHNTPARRQRAA